MIYGTATIRDTVMILPTTRRVFDIISWEYKSQVLHLPKLPFQLKISTAPEGAIFDVQKNDQPAVTNICCFKKENTATLLSYVEKMMPYFSMLFPSAKIIEPVTPCWLYSIVVNPLALAPAEIITAGEVELYIYEQLYNACFEAG